jgi:hypothetical protein
MGFFVFLVFILFGYNFWQIQQLKTEIARLSAHKSATEKSKATLSASLASLRLSKQHTEKAQRLLSVKKIKEASAELALAADAARKASDGARDADPLSEVSSIVQSLSQQASAKVSSLSKQASALWSSGGVLPPTSSNTANIVYGSALPRAPAPSRIQHKIKSKGSVKSTKKKHESVPMQ